MILHPAGAILALGCRFLPCLILLCPFLLHAGTGNGDARQRSLPAKPSTHETPASATTGSPPTDDIHVVLKPERPLIERRQGQQLINFDLLVENKGQQAYTLIAIKLSVYDRNNHLEIKRELNENGKPAALDMVGNRLLQPGAVIDIFQPFYEFDSETDLGRLHFDLLFLKAGRSSSPASLAADNTASLDIRPRPYHPAAFCLPLHGLLLVHDGHDFYSHHRRYSLATRFKTDPANALSANLYAYDFVRTTNTGQLFKGDPYDKRHWLSYSSPIFAPDAGVVVAAVADIEENSFTAAGEAQSPPGAEARDPNGFGNHVRIRHADGRVSWLLHMQPGSIPVKAGDHVQAGQLIGKVGFSGDSLFPHLHYTVTDASSYPSQGVPSYFKNYTRILGLRHVPVGTGQIDTGDIIQNSRSICP